MPQTVRTGSSQPPSALQSVDGHQHRTDDQNDGLQRLGVGHRPHAAQHGVQAGQDDHQHRADPETVEFQRAKFTFISGSSVAKTTPPAKMPTAIFVST